MDKFPFEALVDFLAKFVEKLVETYNKIIGFMNKEYLDETTTIA